MKKRQPIDPLTFKIAVNNYNKKYETLLENQKTLLKKFVLSGNQDNFADLVVYLSEEIYRIEKNISESINSVEEINKNKIIKENALMILNLIKEFRYKEIDEELIKTILKLQKIEHEILT
jgi:hypothetical protein